MKDYINPLLLLIVIALLSWKVSAGIETPSQVEIWLLTLCVSCFIVNGLLSFAQALARRKSIMNVVWSMVYLIFCSCCWVTLRQEKDYHNEIAAYNELNAKWQAGNSNPFWLKDKEGRSLLELAAILGKKMAVRGLLAQPEAKDAEPIIRSAALHAAENGRHELLHILSQQPEGFNFDHRHNGSTPLIAAVLNNKSKCVSVLLSLKADPNQCDENGISPLMHAVIDNNRTVARILIENGADPTLKDWSGRDAISCSRSEAMDEVLAEAK